MFWEVWGEGGVLCGVVAACFARWVWFLELVYVFGCVFV